MSVYNRTAASTFLLHLFWLCWFDLLRPFVSGFLQFFLLMSYLGDSPMAQVSTDQRGRLMMTTERLNQSTDRIKESRRTMLETEELGVSILQDLHQQRQSLLHAHTTVCTCLSSTLCSVYLGVSCSLLCYLHRVKIGFHITFHIPICSLIV